MIRSIVWTVLLCTFIDILLSTLKGLFPFLIIVPDLSLCILVYSAYVNGSMTGQIAGFFSGLFKDFLSPAPLGMNCLIRTLIGALTGIFKGNFFLDVILLPVILCTATTVGKVLITFLLHLIMGSNVPVQMYSLLSNVLWIELGLNAFFAPLLFLLLKKFKFLLVTRR